MMVVTVEINGETIAKVEVANHYRSRINPQMCQYMVDGVGPWQRAAPVWHNRNQGALVLASAALASLNQALLNSRHG